MTAATAFDSDKAAIIHRLRLIEMLADNPEAQRLANARSAKDVVWWFNNFAWTYDPRAATKTSSNGGKKPSYVPFNLFPRQEELVLWLEDRLSNAEEGLVEKSRDVGWTWVAAGYALNKWLYHPGFKTTFGSRKEAFVDKLGDPDAIFGKIRLLLDRLPAWMLPPGFDRGEDDNFLRIINPFNGNIISGEAGDNMGRGGRSTLYIIDEAAFIERAEKVEAAIVANADCRIWASSVNGMGNLFATKRHGGVVPVFRFHWRDDPRKDDAWAAQKQGEISDPVAWAREYDIDYTASMDGICIPAKWVDAATRIGSMTSLAPSARAIAGLDIGGGRDKSVYIDRRGPIVGKPESWGNPDTIETANRALDFAKKRQVRAISYDTVGVGIGVASALSRMDTHNIATIGVNVGDTPTGRVWPDGRTSKEMFRNLKAELWWLMREAFKRTYEHLLYLEGAEGGQKHSEETLISIPQDPMLISQLPLVRWFRTDKGQIIIESKAELKKRGISSPDFADALALTFFDAGEKPRSRSVIDGGSMAAWV